MLVPLSLHGPAVVWFRYLRPASVASFHQLTEKILTHYAFHVQKPTRLSDYIKMMHVEGEAFLDDMARWKLTSNLSLSHFPA